MSDDITCIHETKSYTPKTLPWARDPQRGLARCYPKRHQPEHVTLHPPPPKQLDLGDFPPPTRLVFSSSREYFVENQENPCRWEKVETRPDLGNISFSPHSGRHTRHDVANGQQPRAPITARQMDRDRDMSISMAGENYPMYQGIHRCNV
ncbi:hypothetical protein BGZ63DRAFT_152017 [Mariannaea sp. PMI_226]|nr:hypothetical protein BGZ63DRAFT_152017 [Mariannaea sp. PMI_226]